MPSRTSSQNVSRHRSTLSLQKTEITIHVYDLLPVCEIPRPWISQPVANLHETARSFILYTLDCGRIPIALWSRHQRSRVCLRRPRSPRPDRRILDQTQDQPAWWHFQTRDPPRVYTRIRRRDQCCTSRSIGRVPWDKIQSPHQELQPLHLVPL